MVQHTLSLLLLKIDALVTSFIGVGKYWKLKVTALSCLLVLVFSLPNYQYFFQKDNPLNIPWDYLHEKVKQPLGENKLKLGTNEHNKQYRLTPILIGSIYDTPHKMRIVAFMTLIEHLLGAAFFYLVLRMAYEITQDKLLSSYFCMGFSFLFVGKDFFWDLASWLIPFAYFFILLSMATRNVWIVFLSLSLSFWSDERALLFSPVLFLWWKLTASDKFGRLSVGYLVSVVGYFVVRFVLSTYYIKGTDSYKLHPRETGADYFWCLYEQFHHIPLGLVLPFEGYWIFILMFVIYAFQSRNTPNFKWFLLAFLTFLGAVVVSYSILDTTKSLCLVFPLLFISLKLLQDNESPAFVKNVVIGAVAVSFLFPTYYFKGDYAWMTPIYYEPVKESIGWLLNTFVNKLN